jgi:hypothetical protein
VEQNTLEQSKQKQRHDRGFKDFQNKLKNNKRSPAVSVGSSILSFCGLRDYCLHKLEIGEKVVFLDSSVIRDESIAALHF